jgi:hypothetical protein
VLGYHRMAKVMHKNCRNDKRKGAVGSPFCVSLVKMWTGDVSGVNCGLRHLPRKMNQDDVSYSAF